MENVIYQINATLGTTEGLTGIGEEWIVDPVNGETIARFWNGNFVTVQTSKTPLSRAKEGPTLILEAA